MANILYYKKQLHFRLFDFFVARYLKKSATFWGEKIRYKSSRKKNDIAQKKGRKPKNESVPCNIPRPLSTLQIFTLNEFRKVS